MWIARLSEQQPNVSKRNVPRTVLSLPTMRGKRARRDLDKEWRVDKPS
jgi:hypothetical protein